MVIRSAALASEFFSNRVNRDVQMSRDRVPLSSAKLGQRFDPVHRVPAIRAGYVPVVHPSAMA
jgi:hypothetical protein